jgi:hypothetical protein
MEIKGLVTQIFGMTPIIPFGTKKEKKVIFNQSTYGAWSLYCKGVVNSTL